MKRTVKILPGEHWWGGASQNAAEMPITAESNYEFDMYNSCNQAMPLYLSSHGRYIWSETPMHVRAADGEIAIESASEITLTEAGETLKDAYLAAMRTHFPFSGKVPPAKFFTSAQYNTWMEFDYNQTQENVLAYAHAIVENGYEPGILMIDEGWHTRYGLWEFDRTKFPDPKGMVDELHALGFKVMLWVVPIFTADGMDFVMATNPTLASLKGGAGGKELFLRTDDGQIALVQWWNGYSAIFNMCKEDDRAFLDEKLTRLMRDYGIDGFKFDGGNTDMYNPAAIVNGKQTKYTPDELNLAWNEFGERYEYHEYKDTFKGGGKAVIQRLRDRKHTWDGDGLNTLLPGALNQGLMGHPFLCPDMVGGGIWTHNYQKDFQVDEELFVRMAQCSALLPMIQFSWAPWRMLGKEAQAYCLKAAKLHSEFAPQIMDLVRESAVTGEPIVRHMEYACPHAGYADVNDQFLLGEDILVAPVLTPGTVTRKVVLPAGDWLYLGETVYEGGQTLQVPAPLDTLPYFVRKK